MFPLFATIAFDDYERPIILGIFAITYLGIAMGHVPGLIALAMASNIGAAATLTGQVAHLSFGAYLVWSSVPVTLATAAAFGII